jgi:hypothetical protein
MHILKYTLTIKDNHNPVNFKITVHTKFDSLKLGYICNYFLEILTFQRIIFRYLKVAE